jgi:hypothetical protein
MLAAPLCPSGTNPASLCTLPDDIVLGVLAFLDSDQDVVNVAKTCK